MSKELSEEIIEKCISYKEERVFNNVYDDFLNTIKGYFLEGESSLFPYIAKLEITNGCNLRCRHCNVLVKRGLSHKDDLTTNQCLNLIDQLKDLGVVMLIVTGGEPFFRKDFLKIVKHAKSKNMCLYIHSNGLLIKDTDIKLLKNILHPKLDTIQISLDGATKETNEKIRGKNTFDKTINIMYKLIQADINVFVNFTPIKENFFELPKIFKLCESLGVSQFLCGKFQVNDPVHLSLVSPEYEMLKAISETIDLAKDSRTKFSFEYNLSIIDMTCSLFAEKYLDKFVPSNSDKILKCTDDLNRISISYNGKVGICTKACNCPEFSLGDIKKNSLKDIWDRRFDNIIYKGRPAEKTLCKACKYLDYCQGGCPIISYEQTGDMNSIPLKCAIGKTLIKEERK